MNLESARRISDACFDPFREPIAGVEVTELSPLEALVKWAEAGGDLNQLQPAKEPT